MRDSAPRDRHSAQPYSIFCGADFSCAMALRYLLREIKHGRHSFVPWQDVTQEIRLADCAGDAFHLRVATSKRLSTGGGNAASKS
jgi:hypothetical protein